MNKYLNGKIYKLVDNTNGNIYIGSTIKTLNRRLIKHKSEYKGYLNEKSKFITSYDIIKNGDYKMELIENYPCENKKQLEDREGFYIRNSNCINKTILGRTEQQYRIDNKEKVKKWKKEFYCRHREDILKKNKRHRELNKDKIRVYESRTFECICGTTLTIKKRARHFRSIKHINFMDSITD